MDPLITSFQGFVADLRSVEKRSIVALTEIARDALNTHPHLAPTLATVLINRIFEAPADVKLPPHYLLDSISKTIGEPYKTYFAASLPELYADAWTVGAPGLHRPLEKLLATWVGVFPPQVLDAVRARAAMPYVHPRPPPGAGGAYPGYPPAVPQQQYDYYGAPAGGHKPMMPDARLAAGGGGIAAYPPPAAAQPSYDYYGGGGYAQPPPYGAPQQPAGGYYAGGAPPALAPAPAPTAAPAPVPDLFSLLSSGALAGVAAAAAGKEAAAPKPGASAAPAASASGRIGVRPKGRPQPQEFSNDAIKEPNPGAVDRLLGATARTRSSFLDRLFVRRQVREGGNRTSRQWYVDLDTWMAGTTGAGAAPSGEAAAAGGGAAPVAGAAAPEPEQRYTVEADEEQTRCALSGERFEQFWDEDRQEWRYRDARRLDADEAAAYGLEEGAIVLVSALGGGPPAVGGETGAGSEGVKKEEGEGAAAAAKEEGAGDEPAAKRVKKE